MSNLEQQALFNLAQIEFENQQYHFQPFRTTVYTELQKSKAQRVRPKTVDIKRNLSKKTCPSVTKRSQLKNQLRVLQESHCQSETPKNNLKVITSQSLFCLPPSPLGNKSTGFPSHPVKKQQSDKVVHGKYISFKENTTPRYSKVNPQEMIREDIMKKFKLRQSVRETQKRLKMNNFLKMTCSTTFRSNVGSIMFHKKEDKFKKTLTNLLC